MKPKFVQITGNGSEMGMLLLLMIALKLLNIFTSLSQQSHITSLEQGGVLRKYM